jgi:four helix bundle protein
MNSETEQLRQRTKSLAIRVVRVDRSLPQAKDAQVLGTQLLRSGTSVGANYRAVCRSRSKPEFVSKIGIVLEEADETVFWLELLQETGIIAAEKIGDLLQKAKELTAIFTASQRTAKGNA